MRRYARHSRKITKSKRWGRLRWEILKRDRFCCRSCGAGGRLEVDHIKPVRDAPELAFDPDNLQALCRGCHSAKTKREVGFSEPNPERKAWNRLIAELCAKS